MLSRGFGEAFAEPDRREIGPDVFAAAHERQVIDGYATGTLIPIPAVSRTPVNHLGTLYRSKLRDRQVRHIGERLLKLQSAGIQKIVQLTKFIGRKCDLQEDRGGSR